MSAGSTEDQGRKGSWKVSRAGSSGQTTAALHTSLGTANMDLKGGQLQMSWNPKSQEIK